MAAQEVLDLAHADCAYVAALRDGAPADAVSELRAQADLRLAGVVSAASLLDSADSAPSASTKALHAERDALEEVRLSCAWMYPMPVSWPRVCPKSHPRLFHGRKSAITTAS